MACRSATAMALRHEGAKGILSLDQRQRQAETIDSRQEW